MSDEERLVERALTISSFCLLEPLINDIETSSIGHADFDEFRLMLDDQLHILLSILYQNENLLRDQAFDNQLVQLKCNLLLIFCEQTDPNSFFRSDQKILLSSLARIVEDNIKHFDNAVMQKTIQTYMDGLKKNCWKKQLGMVHGFPKFCEILLKSKPEAVDSQILLFIVSVGSNLVAHYDPHYKTIGLKTYHRLLEHGDEDLMKSLNIQELIYSECSKLVRKSSEFDFNDHLYGCLIQVVSIEDCGLRWQKFDDVFNSLLTQISTESDVEVSVILLEKIVELCAISYKGLKDEKLSDISTLKSLTAAKANRRTMRWVKGLMQMMISESAKLLSNTQCIKCLNIFHSIYLLTISNLKLDALGNQLTDFTRKLVLALMQAARTFKTDRLVINSIAAFLETIQQHQHSNQDLVNCITNILNHETFDRK